MRRVIAGAWFASKTRRGHELIAAGLLMLAGHTDLDDLDKWIRVGWERRRGSTSEYGSEEGSCTLAFGGGGQR
jgi:hypothetical protein